VSLPGRFYPPTPEEDTWYEFNKRLSVPQYPSRRFDEETNLLSGI